MHNLNLQKKSYFYTLSAFSFGNNAWQKPLHTDEKRTLRDCLFCLQFRRGCQELISTFVNRGIELYLKVTSKHRNRYYYIHF